MKNSINSVWNVARLVQLSTGLMYGFSFIYGLFFFERLGGLENPSAIYLTTSLYVIGRAVILLFDIPSGVVADHYGRKKILVYSFILNGVYFFLLGLLCFISSVQVVFFVAVLCRIASSMALALYSGSLLAWVVDTHKFDGTGTSPNMVISKSYSYYYVGQLIGFLFTLILYMNGLAFYAFATACIVMLITAIYCVLVMEEPYIRVASSSLREVLSRVTAGTRSVLGIYRDYPSIFFCSLIYAMYAFTNNLVSYLWPVALKVNFGFDQMSWVWFLIVGMTIVLGYFGNKVLSRWLHQHFDSELGDVALSNIRLWFVVGNIVVTVPIIFLSIASQFGQVYLGLLVFAILEMEAGYGFLKPCYQILINKYIPDSLAHQRAAILSMGSTMITLITILIAIPSGGPSGSKTVIGWMLPSILLVGIALVGNHVMKRSEKSAAVVEGA